MRKASREAGFFAYCARSGSMSYRLHMRASSSAITRWHPLAHSVGVPIAQLAETSSGGRLQ